MSETPLHFMTVRELGELVRTKRVSPVELAELSLSRLDTLGHGLNAVVTLTAERALRQARHAEDEIMAGRYRGPLHGIPYGAKDLLATSDAPTTWGAAPFREQKFEEDATVIRKLEEAGAVLCAKLAMVELAGGMGYRQPDASFTGPCMNPWSRGHWTGGSSSGSGASVAAGLLPFAIGSETMGSIVGPSANCGLSGLRPTYGRVSRHGAMALSWTLDKLGPMARTADDCGLVLEAIAGHDPLDASSSRPDYSYQLESGTRRFRIAVATGTAEMADPPVRDNFEKGLQVLSEVADIEEVELPDLPYRAIAQTIMNSEAASAFEDFLRSGRAKELTAPEDAYRPLASFAIPATDYIRALRLREVVASHAAGFLERFDAFAGPTRLFPAPAIEGEFRSGQIGDHLGAIGNMLGLPAVSVHNGFAPGNLPTGMQFMGHLYDENGLIAIAAAYQRLTEWHLEHPPEFL